MSRKKIVDPADDLDDFDKELGAPLPFKKNRDIEVVIGSEPVYLPTEERCASPGEILTVPAEMAEDLVSGGQAYMECDLKPIEIPRDKIANYFRQYGQWGGFDITNDGGIMRDGGDRRLFGLDYNAGVFWSQEDLREARIEAEIPRIFNMVIHAGLKKGYKVSLI